MSRRLPHWLCRHLVALRMLIVLTALCGLVYPPVVAAAAWMVFPDQARGSVVTAHDRSVGSQLIGQPFTDQNGIPLRQYFQPRPSAAGAAPGYEPMASGASNLGPSNPVLLADLVRRRAAVAAFDGVFVDDVPDDAVTASGSGLDPDISPAYALEQVNRVAAARGLSRDIVRGVVEQHISGRTLGLLGEPRVNVLELNLAVDTLRPG